MKKIIALISIAALLAFAGCSAKKDTKKVSTTSTPIQTTVAVSTRDSAATRDSAQVNENTLYCTAEEYVTLRDAASEDGNELTRVKKGENVTLLSEDGDFYRVTYKGTTGFVLKDYFTKENPAGTATPGTTDATGATRPATATNVKYNEGDELYCIAEDSVTLRASASRTAEEVSFIDSGEVVTYLEASGEWLKVDYDGETGYVMAKYFSDNEEAELITD